MSASKSPRSYPNRPLRAAVGSVLAAVLLVSCQTTPITGSRSFNVFSPADDVELGREAYGQVLAGERLVTSGKELQDGSSASSGAWSRPSAPTTRATSGRSR